MKRLAVLFALLVAASAFELRRMLRELVAAFECREV